MVMIFVWAQAMDILLVLGSWKLVILVLIIVFPVFFLFFLWLKPWDWKDIHG